VGKPDGRLGQRARALNAFLRDIYSERAIIADGVIEVQALDRAPGFRSTGRLCGDAVRSQSAAPIWCATGPVTGWCSRTISGSRPALPTQ
jgi:Uncharacterized conserved protein